MPDASQQGITDRIAQISRAGSAKVPAIRTFARDMANLREVTSRASQAVAARTSSAAMPSGSSTVVAAAGGAGAIPVVSGVSQVVSVKAEPFPREEKKAEIPVPLAQVVEKERENAAPSRVVPKDAPTFKIPVPVKPGAASGAAIPTQPSVTPSSVSSARVITPSFGGGAKAEPSVPPRASLDLGSGVTGGKDALSELLEAETKKEDERVHATAPLVSPRADTAIVRGTASSFAPVAAMPSSLPQKVEESVSPISAVPARPTPPSTPSETAYVPAQPLRRSVHEEIEGIERDLRILVEERHQVEEKTAQLFHARTEVEAALAPLRRRESELVARLHAVEDAEHHSVTIESRREIEGERWKIAEDRHALEREKWDVMERLQEVLASIKEKEATYTRLIKDEQSLRDRMQHLVIEEKKEELKAELDRLAADRGSAQAKLTSLAGERAKAESLLKEVEAKEGKVEAETRVTEAEASRVHDLAEERKVADERYRLERERHEIEQARWKAEDDILKLKDAVRQAEGALEKARDKEREVGKKLQTLG